MTTQTGRWIVPLAQSWVTRDLVGGKGASLASLAAAGFPVPQGFLVTTATYRRFVAENDLQQVIDSLLSGLDVSDPVVLERAAASIHQAFHQGTLPATMTVELEQAYAALGKPGAAVAVRSSATAEDLPGLSFAGQQATFLNVRGPAPLGDAVRNCWASLWTARAIGYRQQMGVPQDGVAMGVVVQQMVPAEVSGILFTANPTNGNRDEMLIEAARGLGEGIVGGTVTPEVYRIDRRNMAVKSVVSSPSREQATSPNTGSAVRESISDGGDEHLLANPRLHRLIQLGLRVEEHFDNAPQDIEWAIADETVWLLQARPITTLPTLGVPADLWQSPIPGATWVRRQVVEHMPEPLSPLFEDLYFAQGLEQSIRTATTAMGLENSFDDLIFGPFFVTVNGYGYSRANFNVNRKTIAILLRSLVRGPLWLFRHGVEYWREEGLPRYLATLAHWQDVDPTRVSDEELLRGVRELAIADAAYWFPAAIAIGTAKVSDSILDGFLRWAAADGTLNSGLFLRGFPTKALEMEAKLDTIARRMRESPELRDYVTATPAAQILDGLPDSPTGREVREDLARYFGRYGHQIYNLDFVAPTLLEEPLPVLLGLKGLVLQPRQVALKRQESVARERNRLIEETAERFDPIRRFIFRKLLRWAQGYAPYREDALFYVGAAWPMVRRFARELGNRLTEAGTLRTPQDIYYLTSDELAEAIAARQDGRSLPQLARRARERQELREARKRLHPPAAVPPTARMQVGALDLSGRESQRRNDPTATTLRGFAVSPGRVTAPASVILSPANFDTMEPGTILVCPTTTPAWTPLFAQARGLVTDIGGILAHGSIVAREYGIPAVMGTGNATQRISSGQLITVDGSAGTVQLEGTPLGDPVCAYDDRDMRDPAERQH